jgi:penicillin G amidase
MMKRKLLRIALIMSSLFLLALVGVAFWSYRQITGSLPQLDGEMVVKGISSPVTVERDSLGIPTIRAQNRLDLAFATGFIHGQDRFFQMDLLRRNSAGELAELVGPALIDKDKEVRIHSFRRMAQRRLAIESPDALAMLGSYANGVNEGLNSLKQTPFEYLLLGVSPAEWKLEDSLLVIFSMFLDLQDDQFDFEVGRGTLHDLMPQSMFDFLMARGSQWDAPIHGEAFAVPPIPGPEQFDARQFARSVPKVPRTDSRWLEERPYSLGSNNWAVSGDHTADGRAMVADDMHLGIQVPHIWYRASFVWPEATATGETDDQSQPGAEQRITGVTLPGTPSMVVGSNGHIAWGFTNTEGDWADAVIIEIDPNDPTNYLTPDGPKKFENRQEVIRVMGQPDEILEVKWTIWGPIVREDHLGRPLALRWVAHDPEGVNMGLLQMESQRTIEGALQQANLSGAPHQNFVVADNKGRIAWTVLGRIPRRIGHDGWLPRSWADGSCRWDGYLEPQEYPRIVDPQVGRIWTANARVVSGDYYKTIGDSGYDLGARQQQIRDSLIALDKATEADMLSIQLDDRAVFLSGWQEILVQVLEGAAAGDAAVDQEVNSPREAKSKRDLLLEHVRNWGGRASVDSVGYRAVWRFRRLVVEQLCELLSQPCRQSAADFSLMPFRRIEGPLWKIVNERPEHFLDPEFDDWDAWLLASADQVIAEATKDDASLDDYTWGNLNTTRIQHPLSLAVPSLSRWLDMPAQPLPGGLADMPRIQAPAAGASQRMAVSPGNEQDGYMHMPCGQSGHPLSPHYADSHSNWAEGQPSPFLPGPAIHTLTLMPYTTD